MNNLTSKQKKILLGKQKSRLTDTQVKTIIEDSENREFFRFENGRLIEYDCTKLFGNAIFLTEKEKLALKSFEEQYAITLKEEGEKENGC
jgi:hypothetical protein